MAKSSEEVVIIDVSPEGEVTLEVNGVVGPGCKELSRPFEDRLGGIRSRDHKPEYNQTECQRQRQQQQQKKKQ